VTTTPTWLDIEIPAVNNLRWPAALVLRALLRLLANESKDTH
jgi:hypothetical protein